MGITCLPGKSRIGGGSKDFRGNQINIVRSTSRALCSPAWTPRFFKVIMNARTRATAVYRSAGISVPTSQLR